jgi:hypothetical protein
MESMAAPCQAADKGDRRLNVVELRPDGMAWTRGAISARDVRVMRSLADEQPILGAAYPREQARLFFYSLQVRDRKEIRQQGLRDAAERVLEFVQLQLQGHGCGAVLDVDTAFQLASAREWALHALVYLSPDKKSAKARELEIAAGHPLTICGVPTKLSIGFRKSKAIETAYGQMRLPNSGCFGVFPDSVRHDRGVMWSYWCPRCEPSASKMTRNQGERRAKSLEQALRDASIS